MAFVAPTACLRIAARMGGSGRGSSSRRGGANRSARNRGSRSRVRLDPILDDGGTDMTDIVTFATCGKCCNSMMLAPEQFRDGPLRVRCNVCELPATVTLEMLENMDGTPFDAVEWRRKEAIDIAMGRSLPGEQAGGPSIVHL